MKSLKTLSPVGALLTSGVLVSVAIANTYSTTVTQDQVDAGEIVNTGAAKGKDPFGTDVVTDITITTPGPDRVPSLNVTKIALPSASALGSKVTFQLTVVNTGNVTLATIACR